MIQELDLQLQKAEQAGKVPVAIEAGDELYDELQMREHPPFIAPLVGPNDKAPVYTDGDFPEVTHYKGIKIIRVEGALPNYLKLLF